MRRLEKLLCGLTSHRSAMLHLEPWRIGLVCQCGWRSVGWDLALETPKADVVQFVDVWDRKRRSLTVRKLA